MTGPAQARGVQAGCGTALITAAGERVEPAAFHARALAAAGSLPGTGGLVNLCEDRGNFLVACLAAWLRGRTILMPPSRLPAVVADLLARHPGAAVVDDSFVPSGASPPPTELPAPESFVAAIGHTSGSTGAPVAHEKTLASLRATSALNAATIRAGLAPGQCDDRPWLVATVPSQHMYGLETSVLLPLLEGFGVHCGKPLMPMDVARSLASVPSPRVLVSTPVHLRALVESDAEFPGLAMVLSATAPLPADLARRIESRFRATLIEFFGSTETCVLATRRTATDAAWRPYPRVTLAPDADGTTVRAPWLPRPQRLHDVMDLRDDGGFTVAGRSGDIIEVAGKRASLGDLTRRLLSLEGVRDAVVFQPPARPGSPNRCAALVVAPGLAAREIAKRLRPQVDAVFLPRPLVIVPELPRNDVGKLPRERLLAILAAARRR